MAEKKCFKHSNEDAIALCYQCHKPICNACITVTEFGNFCSNECSLRYKEFKLKFQKESKPKKRSALKTLVVLIILIIFVLAIIHIVADKGDVKLLKKIDVVELLFGKGGKL